MADQHSQSSAASAHDSSNIASQAQKSLDSSAEPQGISSSSASTASQKQCTNCSKAESDPEKPLKPCTKCQSVQYCSRDCQKADFKKHKKVCAAAAQVYAQNADIKMAAPSRAPKDGHRGGLQKWQFDT